MEFNNLQTQWLKEQNKNENEQLIEPVVTLS